MNRNPVACRREKNTVREDAVGGWGLLALDLHEGFTVLAWRKGGVICRRDGKLLMATRDKTQTSLVWQFLSAPFSHVRASLSVHLFPGIRKGQMEAEDFLDIQPMAITVQARAMSSPLECPCLGCAN